LKLEDRTTRGYRGNYGPSWERCGSKYLEDRSSGTKPFRCKRRLNASLLEACLRHFILLRPAHVMSMTQCSDAYVLSLLSLQASESIIKCFGRTLTEQRTTGRIWSRQRNSPDGSVNAGYLKVASPVVRTLDIVSTRSRGYAGKEGGFERPFASLKSEEGEEPVRRVAIGSDRSTCYVPSLNHPNKESYASNH